MGSDINGKKKPILFLRLFILCFYGANGTFLAGKKIGRGFHICWNGTELKAALRSGMLNVWLV